MCAACGLPERPSPIPSPLERPPLVGHRQFAGTLAEQRGRCPSLWLDRREQSKRATGTAYPQGRISVLYDVLNRIGLDPRLEPNTVGEVEVAFDHLTPFEEIG